MCVCVHPRELSDIDKDGRLTSDEFSIALHLLEKAKKGMPIPTTLPPELTLSKRTGLDPPLSDAFNYEDKRKVNFEQGRMELERRRRILEEQVTKQKVRERERARGRGLPSLVCCAGRERAQEERGRRAEETGRVSHFSPDLCGSCFWYRYL